MKKTINYIEYSPEWGFSFLWENGAIIKCVVEDNCVQLSANEAGLLSLASHLVSLAQKSVPPGYHFHLDDSNSLENGSCELIIIKDK